MAGGGAAPGRARRAHRSPRSPATSRTISTGQGSLFVDLVNAMPEDKFGFKPTPAQQTFGERVMHIVQWTGSSFDTLGGKTPAADDQPEGVEQGRHPHRAAPAYDWETAVMKEFTDQQLVERVMPPAFLGSSASRVRIFYYTCSTPRTSTASSSSTCA